MLGDIYEHLSADQAKDMFDKALTLAHLLKMHFVYVLCAQKCQRMLAASGGSSEQQMALATHIRDALAAHDAGTHVRTR